VLARVRSVGVIQKDVCGGIRLCQWCLCGLGVWWVWGGLGTGWVWGGSVGWGGSVYVRWVCGMGEC
jgi:hypothetical protein